MKTSRRLTALLSTLTLAALSPLACALPATAARATHDHGAGSASAGRASDDPPPSNVFTATCPAGTLVVSGGYRGPAGANITENRRTAPDTWTVRSADNALLVPFATCSRKYRVSGVSVTGTFDQDNSKKLVLTARCPAGKQPVAGGFEYADPATSNSPVFSSHPVSGRGWETQAFADQTDGDDAASLTAYAYCAPVATVVRTVSSSAMTDADTISATATCSGSETALGGGYATNPESDYYNDNGPDFFYYKSLRRGLQDWKAEAENYGQAGTLTAYAVCTS